MSLGVVIREGKTFRETVIVVGGTHAMIDMLTDIGIRLEQEYPDVYKDTFETLYSGGISLHRLSSAELEIVQRVSREVFQAFTDEVAASADPGKFQGRLGKWNEYLSALENDARLS